MIEYGFSTERSCHEYIDSFALLEKNWDSYNADPIPEPAREGAKAIVTLLFSMGIAPDFICPTNSEEVVIELYGPEYELVTDGDGAMHLDEWAGPEYVGRQDFTLWMLPTLLSACVTDRSGANEVSGSSDQREENGTREEPGPEGETPKT